MIKTDQVQAVIEDPRVQGVTLTGSHRAGAMVAAEAGKVTKKTVLELGGSDPYVILEDADLDLAAKVCAQSRLINSGQSCIAAKRFIVAESRRHEFEEKLVAAMQGYQMGPPDQDQTQIGPQARQDLQEKVERQVRETLKAGAQCLLGGKLEDSKGFYYPPTVLTDVRPGMAAFEEEVFGPVAAVISARNEVEAVQLANQSRFGLGAAVFTRDIPKGEFIATHELDAGNCTVNAMVQSDPRLPFGGIKQSGYGRELARAGMLEFVNIKSVVINE
jgi:succinate-semialdehyde dehydrogenase/glutarate-semialdehyde dehydrogenase